MDFAPPGSLGASRQNELLFQNFYKEMIDLEIFHVIIISINYCLQIALPEAGAFNDPVLKIPDRENGKIPQLFLLLVIMALKTQKHLQLRLSQNWFLLYIYT